MNSQMSKQLNGPMLPVFTLLVAAFLASLAVGAADIPMNTIFEWLRHQLKDESLSYILTNLRLPRTLAALSVGAALGLAGLLLQALLDNPLAEPYTLGVSGGATLGALTALLLQLSPQWIMLPLGGLIGCAVVALILLFVLRRSSDFNSRVLILVGILISLFCGSVVVLLISLLEPQELQSAMRWMMGFCGTPRDQLWPMTAAVVVATLIWINMRARSLDSLLLGDDLALSTGSTLSNLRREIVIAVSLLTATSVSLMGLIGFVGLIAPHVSFLLTRSRRFGANLLVTPIVGGILLITSDVVGRIIGGTREIPAGSLVALIGAPLLAYFLLKRFRHA